MVKVLDFGLAKLTGPPESGPHGRPDVSQSPTITSPAMMTGIGTLLGTAAYMSPEQAKGRPADKRSDVWAFGCVLYEMLTGRGPFVGDDMSDTLANVLKREPDWAALPPDVPLAIRTLLQSCLLKDRRSRISDVAAALFVLNHHAAITPPAATSLPAPTQGPLWRRLAWPAAAVGIGALVAGAAVWWALRPVPLPLVVTAITTSGSAVLFRQGGDRDIAITPDGSRIVYRGDGQLLVRALNQLEPRALSGLGAPRGVFLSPDGQSIGFFDGNTIKKVSITGGPPATITSVDGPPRGATWGPDGSMIFATDAPATGLQRVADSGGAPTVLTASDRERGEADHRFPEFLPGGAAVLFTITSITGGLDNAQIAVLDLATGKYKRLLTGGSHAHSVPTGHLVYGVAGTLRAVAFDLARLEVLGTSQPVLEGVVTTFLGAADAAVAANGSLVFVPGAAGEGRQLVVSVDRQGRPSPLPGLPLDRYRDVRVSPEGQRLALATQDDLWIYSFARESMSKLTTDSAGGTSPLWTRDGQRVIFTSNRMGYPQLFSRTADSTGSDELFLERAKDSRDLHPLGWTADGQQFLLTDVPQAGSEIVEIATARPSASRTLISGVGTDSATLSPDGRWIAYQSAVFGRSEIYVEKYPELGGRQPISTAGGRLPLWSRDGRELFFSSLDARQMMVAQMRSGTALVAERPRVLFDFPMAAIQGGSRPYDLAPDGRFLIIRSGQADAAAGVAPHIVIVQNWFEELKRLVPVN